MKKSIIKISALCAVFFGLVLTGCSSDDDSPAPGPEPTPNTLEGSISEDLTLDPTITYKLTGSFNVLEGAKLTIPAGTQIVAEKGTDNYIAIFQGAEIDVQGNASSPVLMTSEDGNPGDWGGLLLCGNGVTSEGIDATAEVGSLVYGGTDNADSSGSIKYLTIAGAGAQINAESQYNGLTMYAVGSGTTIDNVAILNGSDDGVEFFGGAVSVTNLYLENNEDDAIDWTEGWNGTVTNAYVLHTIEGFSTVVEADGTNNNPKLVNLTAVSTVGGTALQFKKESGATITGLSLTGYDTSVDMANDGPLANILIEGVAANPELTYTSAPTVSADDFSWVSTEVVIDNTLLQGTIEEEVTLDASVAYTLNSSLIVLDGGKLIIPAGTKITARDGGTDVYIAVLKGGEIDIQGTEDNPVVMASANGNPGDWGGLTLCGDATTSEGVNATAEVGGFIYGGSNDADSSGSIKNLVIIGTGAQINSESQYNGVSFYAVGSETIVENIAVINGADDGVEFFGGTVSATNIYLENNEDDAVDWTEGWNGTVTNTYVSHTVAGFSTAVEADGTNGNPSLVNFTAVSTVDGTALQFKKESGATFTNAYVSGYATNVDMANDGPVSNIIVDDTALTSATDDVFNGTILDISGWSWIEARL
ncbi:hypothetical protein JoomaDRAFT_0658 [Galbibacter orientalis DSM 19592]|uniref:Lipoprotein n=1 Tax=Galbibacter orientalis DSM 19592 TaxID=926559 RepID=I3C254_9FLAO|nr:hypothetical protein [Galbibacter orientalis]EIJ37697.1 hypothetical protein JoomaDRAFT_0658 [Galbibacter orientalis DSM 19592]